MALSLYKAWCWRVRFFFQWVKVALYVLKLHEAPISLWFQPPFLNELWFANGARVYAKVVEIAMYL